jgi:predicted ATPase with chaperone activity
LTLAHAGALFLDEFAEYQRQVLRRLLEPKPTRRNKP